MVAKLNALQIDLAAEIRQTTDQLKGINADLAAVKVKIADMQSQDRRDQEGLRDLAGPAGRTSTRSSSTITAKEAAKRTELAERKALLADRLRSAYDTDRTSLLESFLSGGTFTDLLAEMSYYIDVGEQDKALADQIAVDQETLAAIHQTTSTRGPGPTTCASRRPPRSAPSTAASRQLKAAKAELKQAREAGRRGARRSRSATT